MRRERTGLCWLFFLANYLLGIKYICTHTHFTYKYVGQWLVLVRPNYEETPEVKCAKRKCSDPDLYWPLDGFCYDAETARRRRLCPQPGTELVSNEFGDGHCGCRRSGKVPYVKVVTAEADTEDENTQPCYPLYSQGPCPQGQVLEPIAWG